MIRADFGQLDAINNSWLGWWWWRTSKYSGN